MALSPSVALLRTQTDERLVSLAREGHERAFEAIVERYRRPLLRCCRRYLPEARAEDALQQALLQAWRALQRGDEVRDLKGWLYRIAHNSALNTLRVSGYDHEELVDSLRGSSDGPDAEVERRAVVRQTLAGLAALPERQREALMRLALEGASQEEIARDLGMTEGAVRQLVFRARGSLRAAATAITPMPLAAWFATAGTGTASAAVGGAALAKFGAAAVIAGGVAAGPAVVDKVTGADRARAAKVERTATATAAREDASGGGDDGRFTPSPVATREPEHLTDRDAEHARKRRARQEKRRRAREEAAEREKERKRKEGKRGHRGDDDEDDDDRSGKRGKDDDREDKSGKKGRSGDDDDRKDDEDRSGKRSGKGGGADDDADEPKEPREEPEDEGSGGSGSDSPGSGKSGSGKTEPPDDDPVKTPEPEDTPEPIETPDPDKSGKSKGSSGD